MKPYEEKLVEMELADGWRGLVIEEYAKLVVVPDKIAENPEKVFKSDGDTVVILQKFKCAGKKVSLVCKRMVNRGLASVIDIFRGAKARRNFGLALALNAKGVATAMPVAVLWRWRVFGGMESILLTQYIPGSINLYDAAFGRNEELMTSRLARKEVISQVAELLSKLRRAFYWHRDSKAGNFVLYKDAEGKWKCILVDLDGVKRNYLYLDKNHIRTLAKLGETLTRFKSVRFLDLYRGYRLYNDKMGLYHGTKRRIFKDVERAVTALRLATAASDSYKAGK